MTVARRSSLALLPFYASALVVCGRDIPHARLSSASRALDTMKWPDKFPFDQSDLTPDWAGNDQLFYIMPKFVQHAGDECRQSLTKFYDSVLPMDGDVLDLCASFTSHFPKTWSGRRCVALGLNPLELAANPSKTEWRVQDLNKEPRLPFDDESFDVITNSLSVDYLTSPLEVFAEMHRVLRPGGVACMAFTNRWYALRSPTHSVSRCGGRRHCLATPTVMPWPWTQLSHQGGAHLDPAVHRGASRPGRRHLLSLFGRMVRDQRGGCLS